MIYKIIMLSFTLTVLSFTLRAQNSNELTVVIKNIEIIQGNLFLRLCNDSAQFPQGTSPEAFLKETKVNAHEMKFIFENLPNGDYAIEVYQDMNENGKLDSKKFGIPAEPFGFSNNALRKFGPPHFEQAKFEIKGGGKHSHEISLIYRKPKKK